MEHLDSLARLLLAFVLVIGLSRLFGVGLRWMRQPVVVGEILAGIALGPSLLGAISPKLEAAVMSRSVIEQLGVTSQLGMILFMFLVGVNLDKTSLARRPRSTIAVALSGIVVPFVAGCAEARLLYPLVPSKDVAFTHFAAFVGLAMSVTAFPVLARILAENGLLRSKLGGIALACAAVGDGVAWCLLAAVVGMVRSEKSSALWMVAGAVAFLGVMFTVIRPVIAAAIARTERTGRVSREMIAALLTGLLVAALATEAIGLHALFGAFILGALIPHDSLVAREMNRQLENLVTVLLLPGFFALSGLRTQLGLLHDPSEIATCLGITAVACAGKFGGTLVAARAGGQKWEDAAALGVLMNARGLMELILINVALDLGVFSPSIFTMFVVMALVTTLAAGPLIRPWIARRPSEMAAPRFGSALEIEDAQGEPLG